jgi:acyl transferase domain-containing protein/3-hydroxymyristoyl/3-hydroxydecanoyl-(acyl carrier protein) dehydratase
MTTSFEPIAIVGQGCVLPGALSPDELWELFRTGTDAISSCPDDRWRLAREDIAGEVVSDRGGYVRGFDRVFDPHGFLVDDARIRQLDVATLWLLHAGREALRSAGRFDAANKRELRLGAIVGNLSFPTDSLARWTESHWLDTQENAFLHEQGRKLAGLDKPAALNRFSSGQPALLLAQALGLDAGAFALDAACASSLYAIKFACDWLQDRRADIMLAGGVCGADDLFIHVGFTALQALSRTGQTRPFHRDADGLLPAEGAAIVALRRLDDAVQAKDTILGVIRGVGLSNDGRSTGLLVPSKTGQVRAIRRAFAQSGLEPRDISLLECHATGTALGDATELESLAEAYSGVTDLPMSSAKSNLGHALTTAGAIGLLKVLGAMRAGIRPPTLHAEKPLDQLRDSPFRLLNAAEPWKTDKPRRAAVSAFGFGGNNAHLLVEEWVSQSPVPSAKPTVTAQEIAIVGLGACVADGQDRHDLARALFTQTSRIRARASEAPAAYAETVSLPLAGLRFPPADLAEALPQQLLLLRAAGEAISSVEHLARENMGAFVGMQCDAMIARGGVRARLRNWGRAWKHAGHAPTEAWLTNARNAAGTALTAAGVVGKMPNIVTNRLNRQFDLGGPSCSISSEEASGLDALDVACRALRAGEIDAALVGAVDLSCEPAHEAAATEVLSPDKRVPGDAALAFVLKRVEDAQRDGDTIWAVLSSDPSTNARSTPPLESLFGHPHAASGLLQLAAATLACRHRVTWSSTPNPSVIPNTSTVEQPAQEIIVRPMLGFERRVSVTSHRQTPPEPSVFDELPTLHVFSGQTRDEVLQRLDSGQTSSEGPARLVLLATKTSLAKTMAQAKALMQRNAAPVKGLRLADGIYYRERPIEGELAFVFTGPAGAYTGMGRDLLFAFPEINDRLTRLGAVDNETAWVFTDRPDADITPGEKLWGSALLSQIHATFTRDIVGLVPRASIGFCSGETNALFAFDAWGDIADLCAGIVHEGVYERALSGEFAVARAGWAERGLPPAAWETWRITAPEEVVRAALENETDAHLTIINAPGDMIVAGRVEACARVLERVGRQRVSNLGYNMTIHCPEMKPFGPTWRKLHHRPTKPVPNVRFYTHATCSSYELNADNVADALVGQALQVVDFPKLIRQAWDDGVRVFVEHGPQGGCSSWIRRTLGDREHVALPLDLRGESSMMQVLRTVAELAAAGVVFDIAALNRRLAQFERKTRTEPQLTWPAHAPPLRLPDIEFEQQSIERGQPMPSAPWIPPVLSTEYPAHSIPLDIPLEMAPVAMPNDPGTPAMNMLLQRFQQHMTLLSDAHQQFVKTSENAFQMYLAASAPNTSPQVMPQVTPEVTPQVAPPITPQAAPQIAPPAPPSIRPAKPEVVTKPAVVAAPSPVAPTGDRKRDDHLIERPRKTPKGPRYSREQLETMASGKISSVFGPLFAQQDDYPIQVRMPEPPLLLADRVTGIDAEPGKLGTGTIWTETDITPDAWYLNGIYMPPGVMIESGQADLLLISWMGIDFFNRGQRAYRLLGCELMYHGSPPRVGETLEYEITIDGHASQGDVRLFFFHYECRVDGKLRMTVRNGQAGFFTVDDLRTSAGVLWSSESAELADDARVDPPRLAVPRAFTTAQVDAFSEGRPYDCFGPGFELTKAQVYPPRIQSGKMRLFDDIVEFDPRGGPWKRGYLRARLAVTADHWTMQGHFKNDPCMPGTLMCEAGFQLMSFYLVALGYAIDRDGWRFEPVTGELFDLKCRGQVIPSTKEIIYELFVEEVHDGETPTIVADFLGTVDGLRAFHGRRVATRLVPDWPLTVRTDVLASLVDDRPSAKLPDGFAFNARSILAAAWGRPSEAFGPAAEMFHGMRRLPRLPGPPFLYMSRVKEATGEYLGMEVGSTASAEFDVPSDAWYFADNGSRIMPFAVLLEAALQPCGWLSTYMGCPFKCERNIFFRNLDGTATWHAEILPTVGRIDTHTKVTSFARNGDMMLEGFDVKCTFADGRPLFDMKTRFGHFPREALAQQAGLPTTDGDRARRDEPSAYSVDLSTHPQTFFGTTLRLASGSLLMIDRITGYWPDAGRAGLGRMRAEKTIDPSHWFFKLHFYDDPVQPGSLGLEALVQLLQAFAIERGLGREIERPRFQALAVGIPFQWKYRGQVVPLARTVTVEIEITAITHETNAVLITADGSLWVDGKRIYEVIGFPMRVVSSGDT